MTFIATLFVTWLAGSIGLALGWWGYRRWEDRRARRQLERMGIPRGHWLWASKSITRAK